MFEKILKGLVDKDSMKKDFDEYKKQYPELASDLTWGDVKPECYNSIEEPFYVNDVDPTEASINFDTLNTLTKEHYSPQARVNRMLLHAKVAAEKGSWWCNIPDVGEEEIALLKSYGFRIFKKHVVKDGGLVEQFSINWADVQPKDDSLAEVE